MTDEKSFSYGLRLDLKTRQLVAHVVSKYGKAMPEADVRSLTASISQFLVSKRTELESVDEKYTAPRGENGGISGEWSEKTWRAYLDSPRGQKWLREHEYLKERN